MTVALQPQTAASRGASLASPFHELRRARQVQGRLLATRSATCGGLECGGCSRPARGLGGDLFDFVPFAAGRFALAVGDASGKGIAAALIATVLQAGLRSQYDGPTAELAARVRGLNRLLFDATAPEQYATLLLAEYDEASASLHYVNCGHPEAFVIREAGGVEPLRPTGPPLGMFDAWWGETSRMTLHPGDALLLVTDGVAGTTAALLDAYRARAARPAAAIARELVDEARRRGAGSTGDDATVVVARLLPRDGAES